MWAGAKKPPAGAGGCGPGFPGARFLQVGPDDAGQALGFAPGAPAAGATGPLGLVAYLDAVRLLDVSVVPLADTAFNGSKSGLKVLEAAFSGVVPVMSPTPDNLRLHALGVGVVASRPREWERQVAQLLVNEGERLELAGRGREVAVDWTIEGNVGRWVEAWWGA